MIYDNSSRPMTTTEFIVHSLSREILNGKIKSGSRLTQNEISKKFNVSQTPAREALKILTAEGLISFDPYKGAIVAIEACRLTVNSFHHQAVSQRDRKSVV